MHGPSAPACAAEYYVITAVCKLLMALRNSVLLLSMPILELILRIPLFGTTNIGAEGTFYLCSTTFW